MTSEEFTTHNLRATVLNGESRPLKWRKEQLSKIKSIIENHEGEVLKALDADLSKPQTEALFELIALKQELALTEKSLREWMHPKKVNVPIFVRPGTAKVKSEPLGCVLIIGAWNYPFMLTLQPLISALAAGNTAVLKPSEYAPATSRLIAKLIKYYFTENIVKVMEGDAAFSEQLVNKDFDHIFFTGGNKTAVKVMLAAAKSLTPVTLELGGQNPAIVLKDADLEITARRIVWGKSINAGQTCLAPNHVLVEGQIKDRLVKYMIQSIQDFYGAKPINSSSLGKINFRQFERVHTLLNQAKSKNKILFGGEVDEQSQKISPTLIDLDSDENPLMEEELFGPLLPIKTIENLDSALQEIRNKPKPLAIYMFGGKRQEQNTLLENTSSGGVCFNDVIMQAAIPDLPFGGVGSSGMGKYHGRSGFENFSHQKSILERSFWMDIKFRYPPYKIDLSFVRNVFK